MKRLRQPELDRDMSRDAVVPLGRPVRSRPPAQQQRGLLLHARRHRPLSWSPTGWAATSPGEVASRIAVDAIQAFIEETAGADKNRTWPFPFEPALSLDANRIKAAFRLANRRIASTIAESQDLRGMATTASALLAGTEGGLRGARRRQPGLRAARTAQLTQITHDHSWVEEQVRAGTLSPSAARLHPWRNVVTRALSGGEDPEVDVTELNLHAGRALPALFRRAVLGRHRRADHRRSCPTRRCRSTDVCRKLIDAANAGGGPDNITAVVLEVDVP